MFTCFVPFEFIQIRSDITSVAATAQHEPHSPWSGINEIDGQFGQCFLASNSVGIGLVSISMSCTFNGKQT